MLSWERNKLCELDKGLLADTLNAYAGVLSNQDSIASSVDGKDNGDKNMILQELSLAAEDIRSGKVAVAKLTMREAWVATSIELIDQRKPCGYMKYRRAITVALLAHKAFEPLMAS